jgi:putative peptidoglycan lipid II flippase
VSRDGGPRTVARGLAGAALLIAAVTVVARIFGFGRWLVFSKTVGTNCLADVYNTANLLPNVLFEVVAGGALASVVVPLVVAPLERGDRAAAGRTVSALLTWSLLALVPVGLLAAVFAGPLVGVFLGSKPGCDASAVDVGTRMLLVFLPQLPFYAVAVVLSGALQAHRRFVAPAVAPLVSSIVVIGAYVAFAEVAGAARDLPVTRDAELILSVGTTLGVAALGLTVIVPAAATGLRLRPTLAFPPGVAAKARTLALAGLAVLLAQQVSMLVVNWLANHRGGGNEVTLFVYAWAVYLLPYAVLAIPIATSAFPQLAAAASAGDGVGLQRLTSASTRAVLIASAAGAGVLAAAAVPVARVFALGPAPVDVPALAWAITAFAPGLLGYGLVAHLGRVLYAAHRGRQAAWATVLGWGAAVVADVILALQAGPGEVVVALGVGNSIGMTVAGVLLLAAVRRAAGPGALESVPRSAGTALLAGVLAAVAGGFVGRGFGDVTLPAAVAGSGLAALLAAAVFAVVLLIADRPALHLLLRRGRSADG